MSWFQRLFSGGPAWDDEPRAAQLEAARAHPAVAMGLVRLEADCDEIPDAQGPFGLCATNPIPVNGPPGQVLYLNRLRAPSGVGFFYHRPGTEAAPNYPHPVDRYEVLAVDGSHRGHVFLAAYHPRRSQRVPDGLSRTSWQRLDPMTRLMIRVPGFGTTREVPDFPWGLPEAIRMEPALRQISPTLGETMARRCAEMLRELR